MRLADQRRLWLLCAAVLALVSCGLVSDLEDGFSEYAPCETDDKCVLVIPRESADGYEVVLVSESADEIRISVEALSPASGDVQTLDLKVELELPLGDRAVIDHRRGQAVSRSTR